MGTDDIQRRLSIAFGDHLMRRLTFGGLGIAAAYLLMAGRAEAAVVVGRVIDSAGQPVAGAEIRAWRKMRAIGGVPPNQPVAFADGEVLHADDAGHFKTPDIFDATTPVRLVAQAEGLLAGRSGWLLPKQEVTQVGDLVLTRLRGIVGQVVDAKGAALAGATVFNGDGHKRVETRTGRNGKFFLDSVPADALFLFAEKAKFRFTGIVLGAENPVELRMARTDEPIEPLRTQEPVVSDAERLVLARRLLDPYLDAVSRQGSDKNKYWSLHEFSTIDPVAAFERLDGIGFANPAVKEDCRGVIILNWMQRKPTDGWDDIRAAIESSHDNGWAVASFMGAALYYMPKGEGGLRRDWIAKALTRARTSDETTRAVVQSQAAEGLWRLGDREGAAAAAREAEAMVKKLPGDIPLPAHVVTRLARALAPIDLPAALGWLDRILADISFAQAGAFIALDLASIDPAQTEEIWNHVRGRQANDRTFLEAWNRNSPDICFRLAQTDPERARRIAAAVDDVFWRVQARGAVTRAAKGTFALELLREAIADPDLPQMAPEERPFHPPRNAAIGLAGLLPAAEAIEASEAREMLWKALFLRPLKPTVLLLDDETLLGDVALAQRVARYEPAIARRLLASAVQLLPQLASPVEPTQKAMPVVVASAFVDANSAVEVLDRLPEPPDVSWDRHAKNAARTFLVRMLALRGSDYWKHAGFWEPSE
jgi:hypothetical protein